MRFRRWKVFKVPFVVNLSIMYSTRTGSIKPGRFRLRKTMRNVCLHARHYHLCYAFITQRWVLLHRNSNHSTENLHKTYSGPSNWQRQNA
ncbi:hypothetical protein E2C01_021442 [Portunus trituberculatus]|uniref:Uncharacterized protein n=1 Tax=Portunus trituberculatus TaxID=210409 RepID=A0A5B7E633_PORTR|nr:hypothetical protein [Portunus trituberculatus]